MLVHAERGRLALENLSFKEPSEALAGRELVRVVEEYRFLRRRSTISGWTNAGLGRRIHLTSRQNVLYMQVGVLSRRAQVAKGSQANGC